MTAAVSFALLEMVSIGSTHRLGKVLSKLDCITFINCIIGVENCRVLKLEHLQQHNKGIDIVLI